MDISSYLKVLLKTQKEVGVAGLGTFFKKKIAGRYDSESHSFIPPNYLLSFTTDVSEDTLLRDYICKKRNISAESADYFINGFAQDINGQIDQHEKAILAELGTITKNNGEWIIEKTENESADFGFYGLPPISESVAEANTEVNDEIDYPSQTQDTSELEDQLIEEEPQKIFESETFTPETSIEDTTGQKTSSHETTTEDLTTLESDDQEVYEEISEQPPVEYRPISDETQVDSENHFSGQPAIIETAETLEETEIPESANTETESDEIPLVPTKTVETNQAIDSLEEKQKVIKADAANIWHFDRANSSPKTVKNDPVSGSDGQGIATWLKILIGFLILVVAVVALYLLKPSIFQSGPAKVVKTATVKTSPPVSKPIVVDTISKVDTIKVSTPAIDTLKTTVPVDSATTWEIIGASLTKKEVKQYIAEMKAKGIVAKPIPGLPGRRIHMSIATFNDEKSAREARKVLVKKLRDDELYVQENKHTYKPL
ncbi:hypothetical protein ACXZ1K_17550 [Pedobacter sp. PWIIR3]